MVTRFYIGKIGVSNLNLLKATSLIAEKILNRDLGYICVTNSRTAYLANHDDAYCMIQNKSLFTVPDGIPLVWIAHNLGYQDVERVCGPDLFLALLNESVTKSYSHYFFGSTPVVIEKIKNKMETEYSLVKVCGYLSPPFQPIELYDIDLLAEILNDLKPTFFWCGLGAPKQERLMSLLQPKLEATICVGVGLVFEYFAETVERAPRWMQKCGMEWMYRIRQQPIKLGRVIKPFGWIMIKYIKSKFFVNI